MRTTLLLLLLALTLPALAQQKKVALASVYIENKIDLDDFGKDAMFSYDIVGDYTFDLTPLVNQFRDSLFAYFPNKSYTLLPEATVLNDKGYKALHPRYYDGFSSLECTSPAGYKVVYIEDSDFAAKQLGQLLPKAYATMYISINFKLVKGMKADDGVQMQAWAAIKSFDKNGKFFLCFSMSATDKLKTAATDPSEIDPETAFALCKSAMEELTGVMKSSFKEASASKK